MTCHVVIATRGGPGAKTRMTSRLDLAQRQGLVAAMLADMLAALAQCTEIARVYVATPTSALARQAACAGAVVMLEPDGGDVNAAFAAARQRIAMVEREALVCLLPGDLPRLGARDLDSLVRAATHARVALAPALADGGTGALVAPATLPLRLAYGPGSFGKHLAAARALGVEAHVARSPSLGFDLDRPSDLDVYLNLGGGGRTGEVLRQGRAAA